MPLAESYTGTKQAGKSLLGNSPYRCRARANLKLGAVMTTDSDNELRDLHAARFAELAALREMLVEAGDGSHPPEAADRMRDAVAEILRLQKIMSRLDA